MEHGEIVIYRTVDNTNFQLEVRVEDETVWLNMNQMTELFQRDKSVISRHIRNVFQEGELLKEATVAKNATVQMEGGKEVIRQIEYYNLDVIISVGYRVKSERGVQFRIWANKVLKDYLLKGHALNNRFERLENEVWSLKNKVEEFEFHIKTSLPPHEGIFYNGQIFDAYKFATDLIKSANKAIVLIDNYIDESVLLMLSKRKENVKAIIYTAKISKQLALDVKKFNSQYAAIDVKEYKKAHDRFLILDHKELFHIGASIKDLGKKWFAFSRLNMDVEEMLAKLNESKKL